MSHSTSALHNAAAALSDIGKHENICVGLNMHAIQCSGSTDHASHTFLEAVESELTVFSAIVLLQRRLSCSLLAV